MKAGVLEAGRLPTLVFVADCIFSVRLMLRGNGAPLHNPGEGGTSHSRIQGFLSLRTYISRSELLIKFLL